MIHGPGAVLMDAWISLVPSVVYAFFPGQEDGMVISSYSIWLIYSSLGNALASVLFGDVNPSARLPMTFPRTEYEIPLNSTIQYLKPYLCSMNAK